MIKVTINSLAGFQKKSEADEENIQNLRGHKITTVGRSNGFIPDKMPIIT